MTNFKVQKLEELKKVIITNEILKNKKKYKLWIDSHISDMNNKILQPKNDLNLIKLYLNNIFEREDLLNYNKINVYKYYYYGPLDIRFFRIKENYYFNTNFNIYGPFNSIQSTSKFFYRIWKQLTQSDFNRILKFNIGEENE